MLAVDSGNWDVPERQKCGFGRQGLPRNSRNRILFRGSCITASVLGMAMRFCSPGTILGLCN